jgi:quercetin dioxygenase-like cupin family protein
VIENAVMGARIAFQATGTETNGELLRFDFFVKPQTVVLHEHLHPVQEERFEVVSGRMEGQVDGEARTAEPGTVIVNSPGTPHAWWNAGEEEAHLIVEFRPALKTATLFETSFALAQQGKVRNTGLPKNPLQLAVIYDEYKNETSAAKVYQRLAMRILAPVGRLLGFRAQYAYRHAGETQ